MGSDLAKTASITLITAPPGSGKTLRAVWYMRAAVAAGDSVFACNVNGLNVQGVTAYEDPTKWEELPPGSVLVVDEAQQFFRAEVGKVPPYIMAMETIRHRGIRLILLTQHPALLHSNIRALVGYHEHIVRENGATDVVVYTRSSVIDNVRSEKGLAKEDWHKWSYPTDCYDLYKSAEVHTVKRTIKSKYKRGMVLAAITVICLGFVVYRHKSRTAENEATAAAAQRASVATASQGQAPPKPVIASASDYAHALTPLVRNMPHTAPAFVNRDFISDPSIYCMASQPGLDSEGRHVEESCTCLSEQSTRYAMPEKECRELARHGGAYNPFKAPKAEVERAPPLDQAQPVQPRLEGGALGVGDAGFEGQQAAYGAMRG